MTPTTATALLTAEEYQQLPDDGRKTELVRGRIVPVNMPFPRHGEICVNIVRILGNFLDQHPLGRLVSNDSGVITERAPDTVRGADVAYYSYARVPRGPLPRRYLDVAPELVFEVRSQGDSWREIHAKVGEYLGAGVGLVCVLDEQTQQLHVFHPDQPPRVLTAEQELQLPGLLDEFRAPVARFFA